MVFARDPILVVTIFYNMWEATLHESNSDNKPMSHLSSFGSQQTANMLSNHAQFWILEMFTLDSSSKIALGFHHIGVFTFRKPCRVMVTTSSWKLLRFPCWSKPTKPVIPWNDIYAMKGRKFWLRSDYCRCAFDGLDHSSDCFVRISFNRAKLTGLM